MNTEQEAFPKLVDMRTVDFDPAKANREVLAIMCEEWKRRARVQFGLCARAKNRTHKKQAELLGVAYSNCAIDLECHLRSGQEPSYFRAWQVGIVNPELGIRPPPQAVT